ncbi:MAG: pyridoxamine 5'-phosphate oxidase family protein [Egibacteraceae bacterium]
MPTFTEEERAYLAGQRLGRPATVDGQGRPHVVLTGFRFDPVRWCDRHRRSHPGRRQEVP